jgi:hypothetical protein
VFLKVSATADCCSGSRRMSRPPTYHNIPLSHKEHKLCLKKLEKIFKQSCHKPRFPIHKCFLILPLYFQSVPIHSANVVKSYTKACRRVLTSTLLCLIGSESSCDLGSVTYNLNLKNYIYSYSIYISTN